MEKAPDPDLLREMDWIAVERLREPEIGAAIGRAYSKKKAHVGLRRPIRAPANSSLPRSAAPHSFASGSHRPGDGDRLVGYLLVAGEILDRTGRTGNPAVDCCAGALGKNLAALCR
ncbi:hypothetical protein BQ8794_240172 [Mesorhizobium prunaredense]|uniref:Uncharacterized protein n=1 Tax=Mesorhizobium prunaredense TaxID=1631249 RepID=A0A1R3V7U3_9HYPH|nr:hypothetical protein BQ8794_240172 [Mesorhizobium prunaredense]